MLGVQVSLTVGSLLYDQQIVAMRLRRGRLPTLEEEETA